MGTKKFVSQDNNLIREHFRRDGLPKSKLGRENAREYANEHHLQFYQCSFCGWWHVASKS